MRLQLVSPKHLGDGAAVYRAAFVNALRPRPRVSIAEWAEQNRVLTSTESDAHGRWRNSRTPYLVEIMEVLSVASPIREVCLMKGTQIGGTEVLNNFIGSVIDATPGPMMVVFPTSSTAKRQSKQRIARMIEASPELSGKVQPARSRDSGNTTQLKEFPGGILQIAGANSSPELRSAPIKYLATDEIDEYPLDLDGQGPSLKLVGKRITNFPGAKFYKCSSPTLKGESQIDDEFERSDQRRYFVPCPHCAHEQWLQWEQMRWQTRRVTEFHCTGCGAIHIGALTQCPDCHRVQDPEQFPLRERDTGDVIAVWYECRGCGESIEERYKTQMLAAGRWIAQAPGPNKPAGFHLSALYSPLGWYSWHEAAQEFVDTEKDPNGRKLWTNTVLGLPYSVDADQPDTEGIKDRAGGYRIGQVPAGGLLIVASCDVQKDRLECVTKAYGRGEETWLIDYQVLFGDPVQLLREKNGALDDFRSKRYRHALGAEVGIAMMAIDSGNHAHEVYNFVRQRERVMAVKGRSVAGKAILSRPTLVDVKVDGRVMKKGVKLWNLGTDTAKTQIYGVLKIVEPGPGYMHFPSGLPDDYFEGLTASEKMITRFVKGYPVREWRKDPNIPNEPLDLEVYAYAAALRMGLLNVNWDRLDARLRQRAIDVTNDVSQETSPPPEPTLPGPPKPAPRVTRPRRRVRRRLN